MRRSTRIAPFALDLHVLGTPPAFVLSQDQTLQLNSVEFELASAWLPAKESPARCSSGTPARALALLLGALRELTASFRNRLLLGLAIWFSKTEPLVLLHGFVLPFPILIGFPLNRGGDSFIRASGLVNFRSAASLLSAFPAQWPFPLSRRGAASTSLPPPCVNRFRRFVQPTSIIPVTYSTFQVPRLISCCRIRSRGRGFYFAAASWCQPTSSTFHSTPPEQPRHRCAEDVARKGQDQYRLVTFPSNPS